MNQDESSGRRNIKLTLEYDGTEFVGWQVQALGRSVQGEIENALRKLLQEDVKVIGAGRTDAGVHARGQVGNFRTTSRWPVDEIYRALSAVLPDDIAVRGAEEVPLKFHARFDAIERRYRYFITKKKHALHRQYSWHVPYPLDFESLSNAAKIIEGQHDFEGFSKTDSGVNSYVCTVRDAAWIEEGATWVFDIRADHFVRGMVRALVGTMIDVGRGHRTIGEFKEIFEKKERAEAGTAAPAKGLFLEEVRY